jgi:hypothetical protein
MARKPNAASEKDGGYNAYVKELEAKLPLYESKEDSGEEVNVAQTDYIKVMSLLNYRLNLCTREKGQGKIYKFDHFGQVKKIIYSDLVDIMEVTSDFLEAGFYIILSPKVIRIHGLDELYSKLLTKEKIELILSGTEEGLALYATAGEKQKEIIISLIIEKMVKEPGSMDLNLVDRLSRISGIPIQQKVEDTLNFIKPLTQEEKE